jgi:WD40 repeat protein
MNSAKGIVLVLALTFFQVAHAHRIASQIAAFDEYSDIVGLSFSADGRYLAIMPRGYQGTDIWDVTERRVVRHLPESTSPIGTLQSIAGSSVGNSLAICSGEDQKVFLYDTGSWTKRELNIQHCEAVAFTPDGKQLAVLRDFLDLDKGDDLVFYDVVSLQAVMGIRTSSIKSAPSDRVSPPCAGSYANTEDVLLLDPDDMQTAFEPKRFIGISPDGRRVALFGSTRKICDHRMPADMEVQLETRVLTLVVDLEHRRILRTIPDFVEDASWSADGKRLFLATIRLASQFASSTAYSVLKIADITSGSTDVSKPLARTTGDNKYNCVRSTPDGKYLLLCTNRGVEIWNSDHTKLLEKIPAAPTAIAVSPDSHYLALGGSQRNLAGDISPLLSLIAHPNGVGGRMLLYQLR